MARGDLTDTYVAALQHDLVDLPESVTRVGVVRRPTRWLNAQVDENVPALAPPDELLEDLHVEHSRLESEGLDEATAHNRAMEVVDYDERYRAHLATEEARDAMAALQARLEAGEDIALVCFENTEVKRCHRTMLRAELEAGGREKG